MIKTRIYKIFEWILMSLDYPKWNKFAAFFQPLRLAEYYNLFELVKTLNTFYSN